MTAPARLHGGFTESEMRHILDRACEEVGLDSTDMEVLRGHTNAVVLLHRAPVVVKIARRGTPLASVQRTVSFVHWLMKHDFPTVPLHPVAQQPVAVDGQHAVTFWTYLPQPAAAVAASQIAGPLRELHSLPAPPMELPTHDNLTAIRRSLSMITSLSDEVLQSLSDHTDRLEKQLAAAPFQLPESALQGDPQHRNALHDGNGGAVLCDWDTVTWGHPEWDLVTIEVHCRRFGHGTDHYRRFADRYGFDVTDAPCFPVLRDIRELRMITTNARKAPPSSATLAEVGRRVVQVLQGDTGDLWNIL